MQRRCSFRQVDLVVVAVLYLGNVVEVWTAGWVSFTDSVLFGEGDDGVLSAKSNVRLQKSLAVMNSLVLLCVKCALCLSLAFTADLKNRKFLLYLGSLYLWVITPITGMTTALTRSSALALSLSWLAAVLFVTSPVKHCLIFNQRRNSSRDQARLVVGLFEFMTSACSFIQRACFPNPENVNVSTLATVWAAVTTPLGIMIILLTIAIKSHSTSEIPKELSFNALSATIHQDIVVNDDGNPETGNLKKKAALQFLMFALLLCPAIAVTIVFEAHEKVTRTLSKEVKLERSWFLFLQALTSLIAIPVVSLLVSWSRGAKGTFCDYTVLALAHVLNTIIMLLIYLFFFRNDYTSGLVVPPSTQSTDPISLFPITKAVHGKGMAVVRVYFPGNGKTVYSFQSSLDENPKKVKLVTESIPVKTGPQKYDFSVWEAGGERLNQSILVTERKRYFFVITGTSTSNLKEIIFVTDVRDFSPENNVSCVIVMNTIPQSVVDKNGIFEVRQQTEVIKSSVLPQINSSIQWCMSAGNTTFNYVPPFSKAVHITQELLPYSEYLVMVSWEAKRGRSFGTTTMTMYLVTWYRVSDLVNRTITLLVVTHGLEGVVAAVAKIGYVQFFWMEAPSRLRTTLFACTVVANEVAKWLVILLVEEMEEKMSLALMILSASAGFVHVILGAIYDFKLQKDT